ncbi:uncharacterized protein BcabD6B2_33190 [Babesia caballi]|uniref:Secreted protein n=1 Tax=Babesia caballi TaxID=5871 RepID=A0AAV4LZE5_BABCB|nr:hypothetical protein BcabD6B2_33190 [Babesia caballi]
MQLLLGLLEVALRVEPRLKRRRGHDGVSPAHERDLLAVGDFVGVHTVQKHRPREPYVALPHRRVLGVEVAPRRRQGHRVEVAQPELHRVHPHRGEPRHDRVNDLLVLRPELVPLHEVYRLGGTLLQDKLQQRLQRQPLPHDSPHRRHPGVVPPRDDAVVHKPLQLALGQHGLDEVEPAELVYLHRPKAALFDEPVVLRYPGRVLVRAQRVRDALDRVHDGTGKVVGGERLVLVALPVVVRVCDASVYHRVPEALVGVRHVHLGSQAERHPLRSALQTLQPTTLP